MGNRVIQAEWKKNSRDSEIVVICKQEARKLGLDFSSETRTPLPGYKAIAFEIAGLRLIFWTQASLTRTFRQIEKNVRKQVETSEIAALDLRFSPILYPL